METGNKKVISIPNYRIKTFKELQKDLDSADQKIKKFSPPLNKKKDPDVKTDNGGGVRGDLFDVSSFKNSF